MENVAEIPLAPLPALIKIFTNFFGDYTVGVYLTWAVITYIAAAVLTLRSKNVIDSKWITLNNWKDRIVFFCTSTSPGNDKKKYIEYLDDMNVRNFKGRLELSGSTSIDIVNVNKRMVSVAKRGMFISDICAAYSTISFATIGLCQVIVLLIMLAVDSANIKTQGHLPNMLWFCLVFLWPLFVLCIQMQLLPDWEKKLVEAEQAMKDICDKYKINKGKIN